VGANSNTRTNTPTQVPALPAIPAGASPELRKYLETLSQVVSIRLGRRGDPRDRAVTLRELIDGGLAKEFASSPFDPNRSGNVGFASPQAFLADLAVPPAPTGFTVNGAYSQINLNWDYPSYSNHSHTEVHVHTSDVIGDATLLGIQTGRVFVDPVGSNQTRYYWVRHVNTDGVAGPFNSASGTAGTTATDVSHLLSVLSSAIDSSELTQTLTDRIDLIDAAATVNGSVAYRVAEEASARATAISAEASARAAAIASIVTDISIHDSNQAYAVGQIVRISNSSSKLYICIQAIAANASVAVTNTAYWKLYGDYDALKSSTDTSAAAITQINTISSSSTSAAAAAINSLNSEVFDSNGGSLLATAAALNTVQAEVFPDGTSSASRIDTLDAEVFDTNGGSLLATAAALNTVQAEVFPNGTSSASRIDDLESTVNHADTGVSATSNAVSALNTEVFPNGNTSASSIDALESTVNHADTGVGATASAVSALNTEIFPNGTSSASRIDALDNILLDSNGTAVVSATNLSSMKNQILNADGTQTATATQMNQLSASYTDPTTGQQNTTLQTALETSASNVNGLRSQYTVKIDNNGNVAGFGLANTTTAAGTSSEFTVVADRFALVSGSDTLKKVPFAVQANSVTLADGTVIPAGVYMDTAAIKDASITSAKIGTLAADKITSGFIDADRIEANSVEASKLILDNSTITSQNISGIPTVIIKDLGVGTAQIKNAAVETLQIKDQAVTFPNAITTSANLSIASSSNNTTFSTIQTLTGTYTGAPVLISGSFAVRSHDDQALMRFRLRRGSTVLFTSSSKAVRSSPDLFIIPFNFLDTSTSTGSRTYTLQAYVQDQYGNYSDRTISTLEVKK